MKAARHIARRLTFRSRWRSGSRGHWLDTISAGVLPYIVG